MDLKLHVVLGTSDNGGKFLVLSDGTVIAGPCWNHETLWVSYRKERSIKHIGTPPDLIGAGQFKRNGVVTSWVSFQYIFATPEEIRDEIQEFIKNNLGKILADQ